MKVKISTSKDSESVFLSKQQIAKDMSHMHSSSDFWLINSTFMVSMKYQKHSHVNIIGFTLYFGHLCKIYLLSSKKGIPLISIYNN